jgi:DNA-binding CsgD family transcriptional regulator
MKKQAEVMERRYAEMIDAGLNMSEMARRMKISRQAVQQAIGKHGLRDRLLSRHLQQDPIHTLTERIMFHLGAARSLNKLASFLIREVEIVSMENASKDLAKIIKEMEK